MSRSGDEMIFELSKILNSGVVKTASDLRSSEKDDVHSEQEKVAEAHDVEEKEPHKLEDSVNNGLSCSCAEKAAIVSLADSLAGSGNEKLANELLRVAGYPPGLPVEARDIYNECKEDGHSDEYCARTTWEVYCQHMNPDDPSCTEIGRTEQTAGPLAEADDKSYSKATVQVVNSLYKLANELDELGAEKASGLVDEALKSIVKNI